MSSESNNSSSGKRFLDTKFIPPYLTDRHITRQTLVDRFQIGVANHKLTLIAAPAGSGKTTLLAAWSAANRGLASDIAWLALEEADNEPFRFWSYFTRALQELLPVVGERVLHLLQNAQPQVIETALTVLLNELGRSGKTITLILDDYHYITSPQIHKNLALLVDHLPLNVRLVIATRHNLPIHLPRLRVRRQLFELRSTDLRFTLEESHKFFTEVMGLNKISSEDVRFLETQTEGWIAGLQLAALSLRGRENISTYIKEFTGRQRFIQDYLVEEVLARQSEQVQTFLLQTSVLARLNSTLCNAVTSQTNSSEILKELEQANLFLVALDDERQEYRYHHLFAEMMIGQLKQKHPALIPILHQRAAEWYEQNEQLTEAVEHYLAAGVHSQAMRLLEQITIKLLMENRVNIALNYLESLPDDLIQTNARLCLFYSSALYVAGRPSELGEKYLEAAEKLVANLDDASPAKKRIVSFAASNRAYIACDKGDIAKAREMVELAKANLDSSSNKVLEGLVISCQIRVYELAGDFENLVPALEIQRNFNKLQKNRISFATDTTKLANVYLKLGDLNKASELYEEALQTLADKHEYPLVRATIHLCLSAVLLEKNHLDTSQEHVQMAYELTGGLQGLGLADYCKVMQSHLALAKGDSELSRNLILNIKKLEKNFYFPPQSLFTVYLAQLWLAHGNVEALKGWQAEQVSLAKATDGGINKNNVVIVNSEIQLMDAKIRLASGEIDRALNSLKKLELAIREHGSNANGLLIGTLVSEAVALATKNGNRLATATDKLIEALRLAAPQGYIRTFVEHAPDIMVELLKNVLISTTKINTTRIGSLEINGFTIYVKELLETAETSLKNSQPREASRNLTERQLEILQLIALSDASNQEIAARLGIGAGTVKRHIENISEKLGVSGKGVRHKAVKKAQELNLI